VLDGLVLDLVPAMNVGPRLRVSVNRLSIFDLWTLWWSTWLCLTACLSTRSRSPSYYCTSAMSNTPSTSTSSSNFRTIFVAAIKEYEKKTKTDLHTHPLSTRLQSCNSSSDILAVLHDKVNEFDESRSHNERLSSWLNPTINVLCAFSGTVAQGAGLVSPNGRICRRFGPN
jgi:hypothetical protein